MAHLGYDQSAREMTTETITLCQLDLTENREIAPNLFAGYDFAKCLRIHDGRLYRGYVQDGFRNRKGEMRFGYHVWGNDYARTVTRTYTRYKTRKGAERGLIRMAIRLNGVTCV